MISSLPFISVVIPARNAGKSIVQTLGSIRDNIYPEERFEIIVVDDASTDDTAAKARSFGAHVVHTGGGNRSKARNAGILAGRGELVAFIDADCVIAPDWMRILSALLSDNRVGGVQGEMILNAPPDIDLSDPKKWVDPPLQRVPIPVGNGFMPCLATGGCMYRRSVLLECGLFDETLTEMEDLDLTWKTMLAGYIPYFTRQTACFEVQPGSALTALRRFFIKGLSARRFYLKWRSRTGSSSIVGAGIRSPGLRAAFFLGALAGRCVNNQNESRDDLEVIERKGDCSAAFFLHEAGILRTVPSLRLARSDTGMTLLNIPYALWDVGEVESRVFDLLLSGRNREEDISSALLEEYDADAVEVRSDIRRFIEQLCDHGLLIFDGVDYRQCYPCTDIEALTYEP